MSEFLFDLSRRFQFSAELSEKTSTFMLVELLSSVVRAKTWCWVQPAGDARDEREPSQESAMSWLSSVISAPHENRRSGQLLQGRQVRWNKYQRCIV